MCDVHEEEKINIYCVSHGVPTCSMCKIFGAHKDCEVSPITSIYQTKKVKLEDGENTRFHQRSAGPITFTVLRRFTSLSADGAERRHCNDGR